MAKRIHIGSEFNNINETWQQNEQKKDSENAGLESQVASERNNLDLTIREEAAEYDNTDSEERLLGGDRASVNDEATE